MNDIPDIKELSCLEGTDPMPFGEYKGEPLENIDASYLLWLYDQEWLKDKYPGVYGYIEANEYELALEELEGQA